MNDKNNIIICRCEDVTLAELDAAIDKGFTNVEDLKRVLRVGMGPCQANTCGHLIQMHLAARLKKPIEEIKKQQARPLLMGVTLNDIVDGLDK